MADLLESINRVRYSGLDFDTQADEILSRIQTQFAEDFNDFAASSLGVMLVDLVSFGLDTLSFYLDRRATDTFLETARTRRSVARLTRQLGYKMRPAIASSVTVQMQILDSFAVPVVISPGFQFLGPNNLVFEAAQTVTFNPGDGVKDIPCYEGETFNETFVSDGTPNQVFELRRVQEDRFIVGGTVRVVVDGTDWTESEMLTFDQTPQFEVGYNDEPPTLRFGDNVAGNIPASGASISVTYITSAGRSGQVGRNTITQTVAPLVVVFSTLRTSITNAEGSVGGDDPESIDEAKRNAPRVFKTRQVAVTRTDYESLSNAYADPLAGRVAVAQAISSRSAVDDLFLVDHITAINDMFLDLPGLVGAEIGYPAPLASAAWSRLLLVLAALTTIGDALTNIATASSSATTNLNTALTEGRTVRTNAQEASTNGTDALAHATTIQGTISPIATAGSDQLTTATKTALLNDANRLVAVLTTLNSNVTTVISAQTNETTQINNALSQLASIGTSLVGSSYLATADAARASAVTQVGDDDPASGVFAHLKAIYDLIVDPDAAANRITEVSESLAEIFDHVDRFLAADCKANLVTVPILARDRGGFYAAPSISLIQSLQRYLDERKEITQTVEVVSGAPFLVLPRIRIRVGITQGFSLTVMTAAVNVVVDNVLQGRRFGQSLYITDISDPLKALDGIAFVNVTISQWRTPASTTEYVTTGIDADGNLIIGSSQVITKDLDVTDAILISAEVYLPS